MIKKSYLKGDSAPKEVVLVKLLKFKTIFQGPLKFAIHGDSLCQFGNGAVKLKFLAHFNRHNSLSQTFLAE